LTASPTQVDRKGQPYYIRRDTAGWLDDSELFAYFLEDVEGFGEFFVGVQRGDDGTDAAFVGGDGGEDDTLGKDAFFKETSTEFHGEGTFTNDDGGYWRLAVTCVKTKLFQAALEVVGIFPEPFNQAGVALEEIYGGDAGGDDRGWMGGTEQYGASAHHEQVFDILAAGDIATESTDAFGEGTDLQGHAPVKAKMTDGTAPIFA